MSTRWDIAGKTDTQTYSASQIKSVIKSAGIDLVSETGNDFLCLCPFHGNRNTPSFSVSKERGAFICFNPSCGEAGSIIDLVKRLTNRNEFEAIRFIKVKQDEVMESFDEMLVDMLEEKPDFVEFPQDKLNELSRGFWSHSPAIDYMHGRNFDDETLKYFEVGYSDKMDMVTVPLHSPDGIPVGLIGRSIVDKRFKNSVGLPKNKTMFNIHRAKRVSPTAIVVESSMDSMMLHQVGFPNAVATLGGHISNDSINLLNKYFSKVIIMTDADEAGRQLGHTIVKKLRNKEILWAMYDDDIIYPHGAKDVGDMNSNEIKQCISNAVPNFTYTASV
jgi:DNA primase